MPYAPGVQDISGQLRAAGIAQAGQAWSQAIGNIGKDVADAFQTYKQNQYMTNQALGKFAAASQADQSLLRFLESGGQQEDPNAPKVPISPEVLKAYANMKSGKSDVYDAAVLGSLADSWQKNKAEQLQRQHIDLQNKLLTQQTEQNQRMADFMKQYMAPQAAVGTPAAGAAAPEGIAQFAGQAGAAGAVPAPAAGEPTPRDVVAKLIQSTGKMPTPAQVTAQLRQDILEYRKNQIESKEYASPDVAAAAAKDAVSRGIYPEGTIPVVKKNAQTGSYYLETTTSSQEPAALAAQRKGMETEAVKKAEDAVTYNKNITATSEAAFDDMPRVDQALSLLKAGVPTGPGTELSNQWSSFLVRAGWASPEEAKKAAESGTLQTLLGEGLLKSSKKFAVGQGAVSNFERQLFADASANASKTPETNIRLLEMTKAAYLKSRAAEFERQKLEDQGLSESDIYKQMRRWSNDEANSLARFGFDMSGKSKEKTLSVQTNPDGTVTASVKPQYAPGTRVKQGNTTYEFDGTNWNEVK